MWHDKRNLVSFINVYDVMYVLYGALYRESKSFSGSHFVFLFALDYQCVLNYYVMRFTLYINAKRSDC